MNAKDVNITHIETTLNNLGIKLSLQLTEDQVKDDLLEIRRQVPGFMESFLDYNGKGEESKINGVSEKKNNAPSIVPDG